MSKTTDTAKAYAEQLLRECPPINGEYSVDRIELMLRIAFIDGQSALYREQRDAVKEVA